jgi:hypothetical protein
MRARDRLVMQGFVERAALPHQSYALLPTGDGATAQLHVWLDNSFAHAIPDLPKQVRGVPVVVEVKPRLVAYAPG